MIGLVPYKKRKNPPSLCACIKFIKKGHVNTEEGGHLQVSKRALVRT